MIKKGSLVISCAVPSIITNSAAKQRISGLFRVPAKQSNKAWKQTWQDAGKLSHSIVQQLLKENSKVSALHVVDCLMKTNNTDYFDISSTFNSNFNGNMILSGTGALTLSKGTTAQRPTAVSGMIRYNTTNSRPEYYNGTDWGIVADGSLFVAHKTSNQEPSSDTKLTYETATINRGNNYNTSNARYTAPVTGAYAFGWKGWFNINRAEVGKLDYHDHGSPGAPNFHGYYSVNAEPSITHYKLFNDPSRIVDNVNKNNRLVISEVGHPHAMGDWDWSGPRITIAYDIVPFKRLVEQGIDKKTHWMKFKQL